MKTYKKYDIIASWVTLIVSILLCIISFFCPPLAEIHPSVLMAVGELGVLMVVCFKLPLLIASGKSFKLSKGDITIEVEEDEKE